MDKLIQSQQQGPVYKSVNSDSFIATLTNSLSNLKRTATDLRWPKSALECAEKFLLWRSKIADEPIIQIESGIEPHPP